MHGRSAAETLRAHAGRGFPARVRARTRAGDAAGPPEAERLPDHAPPRPRLHLRRVGAGRGKDARGGRADRERPSPNAARNGVLDSIARGSRVETRDSTKR